MTKNIGARLRKAEGVMEAEVNGPCDIPLSEFNEWITAVLAAPAPEGPPSLITAHGRPLTVTERWLNSLIKEGCAGLSRAHRGPRRPGVNDAHVYLPRP